MIDYTMGKEDLENWIVSEVSFQARFTWES